MKVIALLLLLCACAQAQDNNKLPPTLQNEGKIISSRILVPDGFERVAYAPTSFAHYLQHFPLKPNGSPVLLYNGEEKHNQNVHVAVLDIDIGERDLQQCADAVMRLRAEYLWKRERFEDIQFKFTNGFKADYATWRAGNRIRVQGNKVSWIRHNQDASSYTAFRKYLTMVFAYAGTLSLEKELEAKNLANIEVGDVFIQGGSPGHAVIVVDKALNPTTDEIVVCLAQSYMPAQSIHILKNPNNIELSPWYAVKDMKQLVSTPEWTFQAQHLKRF